MTKEDLIKAIEQADKEGVNMKKTIFYIILTILITVIIQSVLINYCLNNVYIDISARGEERTYPQYAGKIIGAGGIVKNRTIFPITIKKITPIGSRGMEYFSTLITTWGYSSIEQENMLKYETLENKTMAPLTSFDIGMFNKFTGEYMVNPSAVEIVYSIFGVKFKKVCYF